MPPNMSVSTNHAGATVGAGHGCHECPAAAAPCRPRGRWRPFPGIPWRPTTCSTPRRGNPRPDDHSVTSTMAIMKCCPERPARGLNDRTKPVIIKLPLRRTLQPGQQISASSMAGGNRALSLGEAACDDKPKSNVIGVDASIFADWRAQRLSGLSDPGEKWPGRCPPIHVPRVPDREFLQPLPACAPCPGDSGEPRSPARVRPSDRPRADGS